MIEVVNFIVHSFDLDHLDLAWDVSDTAEVVERYHFYVLRSVDGIAGPYEVIAGPFDNCNKFRDPDVKLLHKWRFYFYKIRIVHKDTKAVTEFGPEALAAKPDRITLEINHRMELLLREKVGRKCLFFPVLTSGQRCPQCWSVGKRGNTTGRAEQQNCLTCYDTTYVGGYATPILTFVQIDPGPVEPQLTDISERAMMNTTGRTSAYPPMKPRDMIVDPQNARWQVEKVPPTAKRGAIGHQELVLHMIPKPDIRYAVPVLDPLFEYNNREYTRPMNTGSVK